MNDVDEQTEMFYDAVGDVLSRRLENFHWPNSECFVGSCQQGGMSTPWMISRNCNWKELLRLVVHFFKFGPDVDEDWNRAVRFIGINSSRLHEICLGVFVSGHERWGYYRISDILQYMKDANMEVPL